MNKAPDEYKKAVEYDKESIYYSWVSGDIEYGDKFNDDVVKAIGDSYMNAYNDLKDKELSASTRSDAFVEAAIDKAGIDHKGLQKNNENYTPGVRKRNR